MPDLSSQKAKRISDYCADHSKFLKICTPTNINTMINIIERTHKISPRLLDFFVTRYSYQYNIKYKLSTGVDFCVYASYKSQYQHHKKMFFDPFKRVPHITHVCDNGKVISSSVGQMNFFKWALDNEILDYVIKNINAITLNMKNTDASKFQIKKSAPHPTFIRVYELMALLKIQAFLSQKVVPLYYGSYANNDNDDIMNIFI